MHNQQIRSAGLKITLPRVKILELFEHAPARHLSAEDIHALLKKSGEEVGLATVYRVLTQFEQAGLLIRHYFEGNSAVFELNRGEHHDHLVCMKCGDVAEFLDPMIEHRQQEIASAHAFQMKEHSLYIYGYCSLCVA